MDKMIVNLGRDYYWNGNVEQCIDKGGNEYTATVAIQENYSVILRIDDKGEIIWNQCKCSCTGKPYCKHVMAVFFAVIEGQID